ncbi:MAG: hypothetical protein Q8O00_02470 [Holophaga sp.]|nr:hypothetical protein [Holophaga sp.]
MNVSTGVKTISPRHSTWLPVVIREFTGEGNSRYQMGQVIAYGAPSHER